jgi:hypothetical protein
MVLHPLAEYDAILVVITVGKRVLGMDTLESDGRDTREVRL